MTETQRQIVRTYREEARLAGRTADVIICDRALYSGDTAAAQAILGTARAVLGLVPADQLHEYRP